MMCPLLKEIKQLMTIMKKELVIFCRLDTNSINLSSDLKNMDAII